MKNRDEEDLEKQADTIYLTSLLLGQIVIWLLVALLVYAGIRIGIQSFDKNFVKMIVIFSMTAGLIFLSILIVKKGKKRIRMIGSRRD